MTGSAASAIGPRARSGWRRAACASAAVVLLGLAACAAPRAGQIAATTATDPAGMPTFAGSQAPRPGAIEAQRLCVRVVAGEKGGQRVSRGLGVAAYTHAFYDLLLVFQTPPRV